MLCGYCCCVCIIFILSVQSLNLLISDFHVVPWFWMDFKSKVLGCRDSCICVVQEFGPVGYRKPEKKTQNCLWITSEIQTSSDIWTGWDCWVPTPLSHDLTTADFPGEDQTITHRNHVNVIKLKWRFLAIFATIYVAREGTSLALCDDLHHFWKCKVGGEEMWCNAFVLYSQLPSFFEILYLAKSMT